jgi:nitroreductase
MGTSGYAHNIPAVIVVVGQMRNFFDERDRHLIYIDSALAAMSFAFAAETLGLSTCLINWPDLESKEHEMAGLIGLEADERPIMLIAVGYPDPEASVPASVKRTPSELLRYNFE